MIYLVTGVAGFIGFQVASQLCAAGHQVVGIDNLNDYYEVSLKEARLAQLASFTNFHFERLDLRETTVLAPRQMLKGLAPPVVTAQAAGASDDVTTSYAAGAVAASAADVVRFWRAVMLVRVP